MSERENDLPSLINIGSCNLYVVNGGFKVGAESANWKLNKNLKHVYLYFITHPQEEMTT